MVIYVINMIFLRASFECRGSIPKKILGVGGWEVINGKLLKESAHRKYWHVVKFLALFFTPVPGWKITTALLKLPLYSIKLKASPYLPLPCLYITRWSRATCSAKVLWQSDHRFAFHLRTAVLILSSVHVLHLEQFRRNLSKTFLSSSLIKYERTSHNIFHHWLPLLHASQGQDAKTWHRIHRYQLGQLSRAKGRSEGKIRKKYRTTNIL